MFECAHVVFTDEYRFEVKPIKRNIRVLRKDGKRYSTECMLPTFKSKYQLVNVWGSVFVCCTTLKCPAQSPNLNPIENVWGHMNTHFRKHTKHSKKRGMLATSSRTIEQFTTKLLSITHRFYGITNPRSIRYD